MTSLGRKVIPPSEYTRDGRAISNDGDWAGTGEGETELNRLFYRLGWTKGWYKGSLRNKAFGQLTGENATPNLKAIKTKLIEMAR